MLLIPAAYGMYLLRKQGGLTLPVISASVPVNGVAVPLVTV